MGRSTSNFVYYVFSVCDRCPKAFKDIVIDFFDLFKKKLSQGKSNFTFHPSFLFKVEILVFILIQKHSIFLIFMINF